MAQQMVLTLDICFGYWTVCSSVLTTAMPLDTWMVMCLARWLVSKMEVRLVQLWVLRTDLAMVKD